MNEVGSSEYDLKKLGGDLGILRKQKGTWRSTDWIQTDGNEQMFDWQGEGSNARVSTSKRVGEGRELTGVTKWTAETPIVVPVEKAIGSKGGIQSSHWQNTLGRGQLMAISGGHPAFIGGEQKGWQDWQACPTAKVPGRE